MKKTKAYRDKEDRRSQLFRNRKPDKAERGVIIDFANLGKQNPEVREIDLDNMRQADS